MDDITRLFGLSISMLVGCYFAGAIPLAVTMSEVSKVYSATVVEGKGKSLLLQLIRGFCQFPLSLAL